MNILNIHFGITLAIFYDYNNGYIVLRTPNIIDVFILPIKLNYRNKKPDDLRQGAHTNSRTMSYYFLVKEVK